MNLDLNPSANNSDSQNSSISRYLGGNLGGLGDGLGIGDNKAFSDILDTQLMEIPPISSKVEAILQRLENDQPLVGLTESQAAKAIFDAINHIISDVAEVLKSLGKSGPTGESLLDDLNRLIEGAKSLFDRSEDPYVLEQLAELWEPLRKKKSPLFHSVHSYFFQIGISYSHEQSGDSQEGHASYSDQSIQSYSEQTSVILLEIIESFSVCSEKEDLLNLLEMAHLRESDDDFSDDDMLGYSDDANEGPSAAQQTTFFFE